MSRCGCFSMDRPYAGALPLRFGLGFDEIAVLLGEPTAVFPPESVGRGCYGMWPGVVLRFSSRTGCDMGRLMPPSHLELAGVPLFDVPYSEAVGRLRELDGELVEARGSCASLAWGVRVYSPFSAPRRRPARSVSFFARGALELEAERIRLLARRLPLRRRDRPISYLSNWISGLPGSLLSPSPSSLQLIERALDCGDLLRAAEYLAAAVGEMPAMLSEEDGALLASLRAMLGDGG